MAGASDGPAGADAGDDLFEQEGFDDDGVDGPDNDDDDLEGAVNAYACEALADGLVTELPGIDISWLFVNSIALECDRAAQRLADHCGYRWEYDDAAILPQALVDSILGVLEDFLVAAGVIREEVEGDEVAEEDDDDSADPALVVAQEGAWATADRLRCTHAAFTRDAARLVELSFVYSGEADAGEQRLRGLRAAFQASASWRLEQAWRKLRACHIREGTILTVECDTLDPRGGDPSFEEFGSDPPRRKGKKRGGRRKADTDRTGAPLSA